MEKYDNNGKGGYFRFDNDNNMSYVITEEAVSEFGNIGVRRTVLVDLFV